MSRLLKGALIFPVVMAVGYWLGVTFIQLLPNDVEERTMNNKVAMANADEAFRVVDEGVAEVVGLGASDYSGGKAKKTDLVQEMNKKAQETISAAVVDMEREIDSLGKVIDEMRERRADALTALEAVNVSMRYLNDHDGGHPDTEVEVDAEVDLEKMG